MLPYILNDDLMCELTHLVLFYLAFPWFFVKFGVFFLWKKISGFCDPVRLFRNCFGAKRRDPPIAIGDVYVKVGKDILLLDDVKKNPALLCPSPSSLACPSAPVAASPVVGLPPVASVSSFPPLKKTEQICVSLDCAWVAGGPCTGRGFLPPLLPLCQSTSASLSFAFACEAITDAWMIANPSACVFSSSCPPPLVASGNTGQATSSSFGFVVSSPLGDNATPAVSSPFGDNAFLAVSSSVEDNASLPAASCASVEPVVSGGSPPLSLLTSVPACVGWHSFPSSAASSPRPAFSDFPSFPASPVLPSAPGSPASASAPASPGLSFAPFALFGVEMTPPSSPSRSSSVLSPRAFSPRRPASRSEEEDDRDHKRMRSRM
ncbi:uncharacterized protein EV154DRAFT_568150 [Mucor mucedo]|uniref:uncharacterized protein n=1 Tax=Mucor mucedo TaxID=29922 RepID=UPI00221F346A|nr:uncharacterized protein EV154DRAFT_568150 [Mucor mucedo]KAI7882293.1 hypothetical protein EV154DRAFT_568150 [Mucor mucedo]